MEKSWESRAADGGKGFGLLARTWCPRHFDMSGTSSQARVGSPIVGDVGGVIGVVATRGDGRGKESIADGKRETWFDM